jgi:uncharacterized damage-inducible protein DinB
MTARVFAALLATAVPAVLAAQGGKPAAPPAKAPAPRMGAVSSLKPLYTMIKGNLVKSAEMMSEENYAFKPTPEVRSFGGILGHLANENYDFCATAMGVKNPNTTDFEKAKTKAEIVAGLKAAFAFCDPAYEQADKATMVMAEMFGMKMTRLGAAMFNVAHDNEHYGNLVTYFRMKGMVPPSSQQSTP